MRYDLSILKILVQIFNFYYPKMSFRKHLSRIVDDWEKIHCILKFPLNFSKFKSLWFYKSRIREKASYKIHNISPSFHNICFSSRKYFQPPRKKDIYFDRFIERFHSASIKVGKQCNKPIFKSFF